MLNLKSSTLPDFARRKIVKLRNRLQKIKLYDLGSLALNRFSSSKNYSLNENIAYGFKARQRLDLYRSRVNRYAQHPLVLFVYGGAWSRGDKSSYRFLGEALTRFGYDVAVVNYHHAPTHQFPSFVDDLAVALEYLDRHQHKLGINCQDIALMGHSAGAFNIASLLYHPQPIVSERLASIRVMIGIAGPYHFDYLGDPLAQDAFEQSVPYQQVMPYYFVQPNAVRHYLFLAAHDLIVKDQNSLDLQQALLGVANHCVLEVIPRTGHVSIMGSIASVFSRFFDTQSRVIAALDESFKDRRSTPQTSSTLASPQSLV